MTYRPSEKASVENPCVAYAKKVYGIKVLKVNPLWAAGWQDRIFFIPGGRVLIIEFKRPGGKSSKLQQQRHKELLEAGYDHHVIDNKPDGIALIEARCEANSNPKNRRAGMDPHPVHEARSGMGNVPSNGRATARPRAKKD